MFVNNAVELGDEVVPANHGLTVGINHLEVDGLSKLEDEQLFRVVAPLKRWFARLLGRARRMRLFNWCLASSCLTYIPIPQ